MLSNVLRMGMPSLLTMTTPRMPLCDMILFTVSSTSLFAAIRKESRVNNSLSVAAMDFLFANMQENVGVQRRARAMEAESGSWMVGGAK